MTDGTLDRLAHAVLLASYVGPTPPAWLLRRIDAGLGGVCLFADNLVGGGRAASDSMRGARPDVLIATDEEGGDVTRLWAATGSPVPGAAALGAVDDIDLTTSIAAALGAALLDEGIDVDLAPVADVNCDPDNPVIGVRSFGADPQLVGRHVAATVIGLQSAGVAACAKHFPGHGATVVDSHVDLPVVDAPPDVLVDRELVPFRSAIDAGVAAVMTAHVVVPALDDQPATVSRRVLVDTLRGTVGFRGAVVTDALDMRGIGGTSAIPASTARSLAAGADLCCLGTNATDRLVSACVDAIVGAVTAGALDEGRLHDAAARVATIRRPCPTASAVDSRRLTALGAEAARRALRIEGELAASLVGAHVVELDRPAMIAVGDVPWGLGAAWAVIDPSVTHERLAEGADVRPALARAAGRPLVIAVRDADRCRPEADQLAGLVAGRPDAVVVDLGWPSASAPAGAARVTTFGASPASGAAAARVLAGVPTTRRTTVG